MTIINPCMLYLEDKLTTNDKVQFFYNMCKCTNIPDEQIISASKIYAMYNVFDGKPITKEQVRAANKKNLSKSCTLLIKRKNFQELDILNNACRICKHSSVFCNSREKEEMLVLRRHVEPTIPFKSSVLAGFYFTSLIRMSKDYAIGTYPLLPLNNYLYDYLTLHSNERYSEDSLIENFINELSLNTDTACYFINDEFKDRISLYIKDIFSIKLDTITDEIFNASEVAINYPLPLKSNVPIVATTVGTPEEINITDTIKMVSNDNENDTSNGIVINNSVGSTLAITQDLESISNSDLNNDNLVNEQVPDSCNTIENISDIPTVDEINKTISEGILQDIENEIATEQITQIPTICHYSENNYIISDSFKKEIVICNDGTLYQFTTDLARSYHIGIELAEYKNRRGLLIYCSYNYRFYFYDIEIAGIETLRLYLSDPNKTLMTFHSIEVIGMLNKYGNFTASIQDLYALYCINCNTENALLNEIISKLSSKENERLMDFYQFAMPLYKEIYLNSNISIGDDEMKLTEYKRMQRLYIVLAASHDFSLFLNDSNKKILQLGYRKFDFKFNWSFSFKKPGVLYTINIPNLKSSMEGILSNSFTMDVCLLFINIPHLHKQRIKILSINDKELIVYYEGNAIDSRRFYDILMMGIRKAYQLRFEDILCSKTYCVVYSYSK